MWRGVCGCGGSGEGGRLWTLWAPKLSVGSPGTPGARPTSTPGHPRTKLSAYELRNSSKFFRICPGKFTPPTRTLRPKIPPSENCLGRSRVTEGDADRFRSSGIVRPGPASDGRGQSRRTSITGIKSNGRGVAQRKRTCFGSRGSWVRFPPPRPIPYQLTFGVMSADGPMTVAVSPEG